ncbi:MAG TPA: tetratricopeptide repeat protein [Allosphingosinicella sp.]|nr:tetratricopeptide repeat protein [Allosphingosinicella sp.]
MASFRTKLGVALAASALVVPLGAAEASREDRDLLAAYAQARAAASGGEAGKAARGYAAVLALAPDNRVLAARTLSQALAAGDRGIAVGAARTLERAGALPPDARLLLLAEAFRTRDAKLARRHIDAIEEDKIFAFMAPVLRAWAAFDARERDPLAMLAAARSDPLAGTYAAEHRPLMLLALGHEKQGVAELATFIQEEGGRANRLRIAAAALLARKGERKQALALLQGKDAAVVAARRLVEARKPVPGEIASAAAGVAEFLVRLAVDLHRQDVTQVALTYARLATFLAPENSETWLVTSELLAARDQPREALAVLANVRPSDPFAANAQDSRIRLMMAAGDKQAALAAAEAAAKDAGRTAADWARLGDLYGQVDRPADSAAAYGEALALLKRDGGAQPEWALHLLRGGALEQADRWPEAKAALEAAYRLAPQQPVVLNYLGYAQLERRENIEQAMKLIAEASKLQPDSAEITDSLGWAHFLRGNLGQAIPLLEKAVEGEPDDAAINEHLGDAYYTAGRRYEARYAWEAALLTAEEEDAARLRAKIEGGLTPKLASP